MRGTAAAAVEGWRGGRGSIPILPTNWFAPFFSLKLWNHIHSHTYEYTTTLFAIVSNYLIINETTFLITHMKNICESYIDPYF